MVKPTTAYKPELDGVRAICIIFTVAEHLPGKPDFINGSIGVDIFFALSGWLITYLLLAEQRKTGSINLTSFYIRRIFRIVPLYLLTIILYFAAAVVMSRLTGDPHELESFAYGFPYFISFNGEYMDHYGGLMFGHSWTLGIEEKFYILWPCALFFLFQGRKSAPLFLLIAIVVLIALAQHPILLLRGYIGLTFGALLAWVVMQRDDLLGSARWSDVPYGALAGIGVAYILSALFPHPFAWNLCISFFGAFLVGGLWLAQKETLLARFLSLQPMAAAGRLTYAVYLTHVLVINVVALALSKVGVTVPWVVAFVICYAGALATGFVLNRLLERPLIDMGRRLATRGRLPRVAIPADSGRT